MMSPGHHSSWFVLTLTVAVSVILSRSISVASDTRGPCFTRIEGPDTLTVGVKTDFTCTAECTPACTYTWSLAGQSVKGQVVTLTAYDQTISLDLECTSLNPASGETSNSEKKVTVKNHVSVKPPAGTEPALKESFNLTCVGYPQMSAIEWTKDDNTLTIDDQMSLSTDNSTVSFTSLLPSHVGLYRCVASKSDSNIFSVAYLLTYGLLSVNISGPDTVEVGKEHTFVCEPNCEISCSVSWTFRRVPSGSFSQRKTVIKWTPDTPNTTQAFTCLVENTDAARSATAVKCVKVFQKPNKKVKPRSGSIALEPSIALCLTVCVGLLFNWGW